MSTEFEDQPSVEFETGAPDDGNVEQGDDLDAGAREGAGENEDELPLDTVFEILRNERRRRVLRYLQENDGEATLSTLAEHIAALENDTTPKALSAQERKRVYIGLYQCHLPKMDGAGVIDYERRRGDVEQCDEASQLERYLGQEGIEDDAETAPELLPYYLGSATTGGAAYFAAQWFVTTAWLAHAVVVLTVLSVLSVGAVDWFSSP